MPSCLSGKIAMSMEFTIGNIFEKCVHAPPATLNKGWNLKVKKPFQSKYPPEPSNPKSLPYGYNPNMKRVIILVVLIFLLASCSNNDSIVTTNGNVTETEKQLIQYPTKTDTANEVTSTSTFAELVFPTPTPFLYTVVLNDTLIGIAYSFNVPLEALLNANPSAENQPLLVGQELIIPTADKPSATFTITPLPIQPSQVDCFESQDESLRCLVLIKNEFADWIQNLSTQIHLIDPSGKLLETCTAYPPLDLLPPGRAIILSCSFQKVPIEKYQPQATIISASNVPFPSELYMDISIQNSFIELNREGLNAQVHGEIILNTHEFDASQVKILAIAFSKEGTVVGFRRWESNTVLPSGGIMPFELMISSFGSIIDRVELIVEGTR
jgi:LysM repeat protein